MFKKLSIFVVVAAAALNVLAGIQIILPSDTVEQSRNKINSNFTYVNATSSNAWSWIVTYSNSLAWVSRSNSWGSAAQIFQYAQVTNNAVAGKDIVNYESMTNWTDAFLPRAGGAGKPMLGDLYVGANSLRGVTDIDGTAGVDAMTLSIPGGISFSIDTLTGWMFVGSNAIPALAVYPDAPYVYDVGKVGQEWRRGYFSNLYVKGTIDVQGIPITNAVGMITPTNASGELQAWADGAGPGLYNLTVPLRWGYTNNTLYETTFGLSRAPWRYVRDNGYPMVSSEIVPYEILTNCLVNSNNWNTAYSWGNHATNGYYTNGSTIGSRTVYQGTPIQGQYIAYTRTNLTTTHMFSNQTATNTSMVIPYLGANISWGKLYSSETNTFSRTVALTFYANNDYAGSNAYWRANMNLITVGITNGTPAGTNQAFLADATGFAVNDLVYFSVSNEFARIAAMSGNVLTFEDNLTKPHGTTGVVSRVAEFGGFTMLDWSATSNVWYKIAATNVFTQTLNIDLSIRR